MKNKNNAYHINIVSTTDDSYDVTIQDPDTLERTSFSYATALGLSQVQDIFFALTDSQCQKILKGNK